MVIDLVIMAICFLGLIIASITDIKTREVPDWLNYSMIFAGLGIRLLYSIIMSNYNIFLYGIYGFSAFVIIALLMFYGGQWGGGDSKLLMGLGALIGLNPTFSPLPFLLLFWINLLVVGAVYGLIWSVVLAIKKRKRFMKSLRKHMKNKTYILARRIILIVSAVIIVFAVLFSDFAIQLLLFTLIFVLFFTLYLWMFVKVVEESCMLKYIGPKKLTEGDWIAKEIKINGKVVCSPTDLGIEKSQIRKLIRANVKRVLVKEGIPFVPSFLIGFIMTLIVGNLFSLLF